MYRLLVLAAAAAAAALAPASARAHHASPWACGLPGTPLFAEYAEIAVSPAIRATFTSVRPPLVLATSGAALAQELRDAGAHTVFWHMSLPRQVGNTTAPADPATVSDAADRLYDRAVATTQCATPVIALNELQGAWIRTPWSATNAQYRANVLALLARLHERGARPYLLVTTSPRPFTASAEAAEWWRHVSLVSDIVLQLHFNGRLLYEKGPLEAGRQRRTKMRSVVAQFTALGIPPARLGLLHGFQSGRGFGGREGLPLAHWLRVVKWEVLAGRQVIVESIEAGAPLGSSWSWGWGDFPALSRVDPQKPITACVYLWARHPALCDGPSAAAAARVRFNASVNEGSIALAPNVLCRVGAGAVAADAVERFAAIRTPKGPLGRKAALAALFQRTLERGRGSVSAEAVAREEQAIVARHFGGDPAAFAAALAAANADVAIARHLIGEQLRRRAIAASLPPRVSFHAWSLRQQRRALARTVCVRDERPALTVVDLGGWLPFLRVRG